MPSRPSGILLAAALTRAWRHPPPPLELRTEEVEEVAPLLLGSGAGALGWWRVRNSDLRAAPAALQLRDAHRRQTIHNALTEKKIEEVFGRLRAAGIEPLLVKGWAVARLFPEEGLRPLGDIDIYVPPEHRQLAEAMGYEWGNDQQVDLQHQAFAQVPGLEWSELCSRSRLARLGETDIRILGPEDQLALVCLHFLCHGGWRPLWLCDIAVAHESRPPDFNWDVCLGPDRRRADWIACAVGLAHRLLGADVHETPVAWRAGNLPAWLVPAVLEQWEVPCYADRPTMLEPLRQVLRHPAALPRALRARWPDPIQATIRMGGPFNELPRFLFQLAEYLSHTAGFLARSAGLLREQR